MKPILVLAFSRADYEDYLHDHNLKPQDAYYGHSQESIQAVEVSGIVQTDTFPHRKGWYALLQLAETRVRS